MADDQTGDLFGAWAQALEADPATRRRGVALAEPSSAPQAAQAAPRPDQPVDLFDAWGQALDADPSLRRRGVAPTETPDVPTGGQDAPAPQSRPPARGDAIASTAAGLVGNTATTIAPFLRQTGQNLDASRANWCAAFVNGVLGANGVEGTQGPGRYVATSFLNWGQPVQGDPQPGDVLVQPRGHPAGGLGGHVGIATGQIADGSNGQAFYLMQSGNLNNRVAYTWEPAQTVVVRRAPQTSRQGQAP